MNLRSTTLKVFTGACALSLAMMSMSPAIGAPGDGGLESGELTQGGRFSDGVQEIFTDVLIPLHQNDSSIVHVNFRGTFLESEEQELNSGFVVRHILPDHDILIGGNLFYDSRWTEHDNYFDQIGAGIEVLNEDLDFRANYYHPLQDKTQTISEGSTTTVGRRSTSTRRITTTTTTFFKTFEEALDGFDVELGGRVPVISDHKLTRAYVGYYDFNSDFGNSVEGWKLRVETHLSEFFTFDAEWIEDRILNDTDFFVGFRIHAPLDFWNGLTGRERPQGLQARLSEMVIRDFRVRTADTEEIVVGTEVVETIQNIPQPEPVPPPVVCLPYQHMHTAPAGGGGTSIPTGPPPCPPPPCRNPANQGGGAGGGAQLCPTPQ